MNARAPLPVIDVERRFEQALRAGRPEWLWFEVPETRWAEALATIETALRQMLAHAHSGDALLHDPVALSIACYTSGTGPLLGAGIAQGKLTTTPANAAMLRLHLAHNRARMARLTARTVEAVDALAAAGTQPIVIKGMHTAHRYFDAPAQRVASDIDLLLRPEELAVAARILADLGYTPRSGAYRQRSWAQPGATERPLTLTYVHRDDPWSIDLHESVNRQLAGGARLADIDALVSGVGLEPWRASARGAVFPPPLQLVHLLVHAGCAFENLTLQRQYEIALVIRQEGGRAGFDWSAFAALCDRGDLWPFLYPALHCVERLAPNLFPDMIRTRSRAAVPPTVRKLVEAHSAASAHRVGRWSWAERYMWADGPRARLRQFALELRSRDHLAAHQLARLWRRRVYRQIGRLWGKAAGCAKPLR